MSHCSLDSGHCSFRSLRRLFRLDYRWLNWIFQPRHRSFPFLRFLTGLHPILELGDAADLDRLRVLQFFDRPGSKFGSEFRFEFLRTRLVRQNALIPQGSDGFLVREVEILDDWRCLVVVSSISRFHHKQRVSGRSVEKVVESGERRSSRESGIVGRQDGKAEIPVVCSSNYFKAIVSRAF